MRLLRRPDKSGLLAMTKNRHFEFTSCSEKDTVVFAKKVLEAAKKKGIRIFLLSGELGSGKTVFVKGLARMLGVKRRIKSPSFVFIQEYPAKFWTLVHADLYRLEGLEEFPSLGLEEYLRDPACVTAIEWSDRLPPKALKSLKAVSLEFSHGLAPNERKIHVRL